MASVDEREVDSVLEGVAKSLLDIVEERNRTLNKKGLLHRMVLISKMKSNHFQDIGQYYERFFKEVQNAYQCEGVTGLLLLYPKHCVHVVEGSQGSLLELLKDLRKDRQNNGQMEKSKILIVSHDIPHRLYQHWSFRVLDIQAPRLDEYDTSETPDKLVKDMLTQLLKLGVHLSRQPKVALKSAMDFLHDKVPELLPQQTVIGYLLESDFATCIFTPEEYLNKYEKPFDVVLASELVWPMPVKLFPYN